MREIYFFIFLISLLFILSCKPKQENASIRFDNLTLIPFEKYGYPKKKHTYEPVRGRLKAQCYTREMIVHFCEDFILSDRIQHRSKIRVVSLETGKSLTFIVSYDRNVRGLCIPERFKRLMSRYGSSFKAKVYVLRCGENGRNTCPEEIRGYASWYGHKHHGYPTASGFKFNKYAFIVAHRWLPFGTVLLVENLKNSRKVRVTVWDRGPYIRGRELDLSYAAAKELGMIEDGVIPFRAKVLRCGN